jgi:hypothetical protein
MEYEYEDCPHDIVNPIEFYEDGSGFILCNQCDTFLFCISPKYIEEVDKGVSK